MSNYFGSPQRSAQMNSNGQVINTADSYDPDDKLLITKLRGVNVTDYGPVTLSDTVNLTKPCIGICVTGTAGNVSVVKPDGQIVVIPASMLPVGQIVPLPALRIRATGTTAKNVWVVY